MQYIPIVNSTNGLSLTPLQWQETGVRFLALDVSLLLQRPGYLKIWRKRKGFTYLLDASFLKQNSKGEIVYRSHDGVLKHLTLEQLANWINEYRPDAVIWPFKEVFVFQNNPLMLTKQEDFAVIYSEGEVIGCLTNEPCDKGVQGYFDDNGFSNIQSEVFSEDLSILKFGCDCETCQAHLTKAYLHHLYEHTPLLAHRFLIVHNVRQMVIQMQDKSQK